MALTQTFCVALALLFAAAFASYNDLKQIPGLDQAIGHGYDRAYDKPLGMIYIMYIATYFFSSSSEMVFRPKETIPFIRSW